MHANPTARRCAAAAAATLFVALAGCGPRAAGLLDDGDAGGAQDTSAAAAAATPARYLPASRAGIGDIFGLDIRTVQFGIRGLELSEPIVELGGAADLLLSFDVIGDEVRQFRYDLTHCDANWEPSVLTPIEYLTSFSEADVTEYDLSFNAVTDYTHFELVLPNQYVSWTKSGNYLLNVYDDASGELEMRLRFCVVEPLARLAVDQTRPGAVAKDKTHQEFDVAVSLRETRLENPRRSLSLTVLQNGDWRTGLYGVPPRFLRGEQLQWDYQDRIVFPAMREWRALDLRTLETAGGRVREVTREGEVFSAFLFPEKPRANFPPETRIDLNGGFVIEDFDNRFRLQAEYARTIFSLATARDESIEPLYLYGALTGYRLDGENRGVYNELTGAYMFSAPLKQGFYNYAYVSAGENGLRPVWTETEGDWFQTENAYQFLLYYRPYGQRYDRLIGYEYVQVNR